MSNPQYEIILSSKLKQNNSQCLRELEKIFKEHFNTENNVDFYVYDTKWISSESIDVVLKSRTIKDRICTR